MNILFKDITVLDRNTDIFELIIKVGEYFQAIPDTTTLVADYEGHLVDIPSLFGYICVTSVKELQQHCQETQIPEYIFIVSYKRANEYIYARFI